MRILVVDDQVLNQTLLTFMLEDEGFVVKCVDDGKQAVDALAEFDPDVVLLDVLMPVMNGYEAAPLIKKFSQHVYLPIIFITALEEQESLKKCLEVGGDDFLTKPFDKMILSAKIQAHTRIRELSIKTNEQNQQLEYYQSQVEAEHEIVEHIFENALKENFNVPDNVDYHMSPATMFNGDLFLVSPSPIGGMYILLGDFTGHGLAAAIGALPASKIFYAMTKKGFSIADIAKELNKTLVELLPGHMFCAATIIEICQSGKNITAWLGGLPEGYIFDNKGQVKSELESQHMALGILEQDEFENDVIQVEVENSDRILIFTDGIIEAANEADELFGEQRVLDIMASAPDVKVEDLVKSAEQFSGALEQQDDLSLVLLHCKPSPFPVIENSEYSEIPMALSLQLEKKHFQQSDIMTQIVTFFCDIKGVSEHRANLFLLLSEAYNNALDHGVLNLNSEIKSQEDGFTLFYAHRQDALDKLDFGRITINADYQPENKCIHFSIIDTGSGFDIDKDMSLSDGEFPFGRGLGLIREIASKVSYNDLGNQIDIVYNLTIN